MHLATLFTAGPDLSLYRPSDIGLALITVFFLPLHLKVLQK